MRKVLVFPLLMLLCPTVIGQETVQLLDSIVTYNLSSDGDSNKYYNIANEFDEGGQIISHTIYYWDRNNQKWIGHSFPCEECLGPVTGRFEYTYDKNGNQIGRDVFYFSSSGNRWIQKSFSEMKHDDGGNLIALICHSWDDRNKVRTPFYRDEYNYNEENQVIQYTSSRWKPWLLAFQPEYRYEYKFDEFGRKIQDKLIVWDYELNQLVNHSKTEIFRDSMDIEILLITYNWHSLGAWKTGGQVKYLNEYDSVGHLILTNGYSKDKYSDEWIPSYRRERAYNKSGLIILEIVFDGNGELTEEYRTEWEYNEDGSLKNKTETGHMVRYGEGFELKGHRKVTRHYNLHGNISHANWFGRDYNSKEYILYSMDRYYYQTMSTGIEQIEKDDIILFPNPTSGIINISGLNHPAEFKIYSIQGHLIKSENQVQNNIDISDLPPGVYILNLKSGGSVKRKTIIKK